MKKLTSLAVLGAELMVQVHLNVGFTMGGGIS
jgi:hypothetical protein